MKRWLTSLQNFNRAKADLRAAEEALVEEVTPETQRKLCRAAANTDTVSQMVLRLVVDGALDLLKTLVDHGACTIDEKDMLKHINEIDDIHGINELSNQLTLFKEIGIKILSEHGVIIKTCMEQILYKIFCYSGNTVIHNYILSNIFVNKDFTPSVFRLHDFKYAKLLAVSRLHAGLVGEGAFSPVGIRRWLARRGLITHRCG